MTGRLVLPADAPRDAWLEARRQGVTASEIAVVLGLSPYDSPYALYWRKRGDIGEQDDSTAMALGRHLEAFTACEFAARRPEFTVTGDGRALYEHRERTWQRATPDRLLCEADDPWAADAQGAVAVLECKISATYDGWGEDGGDEIPVHYRCQVLWQMDVMGVDTGYVACLFLPSGRLRIYEVKLDGAASRDLGLMRVEAQAFLHRVMQGDPPDVDWRPATTAALKRLHPSVEDRDVPISTQLAQRYQAAVRNLKAAEQRKARWENAVRERLGNGRRAIDPGRPGGSAGPHLVIARRDVYDLPEKQITRRACTVDRLIPVKPKETTP